MVDETGVAAERMGLLPDYFFAMWAEKVQAAAVDLKGRGLNVIRMDAGSPDLPPHPDVVAALMRVAEDPAAHGYQPFGGTLAYKQAWADYYARRFGVTLDAKTQVEGLMGSKEGVFHFPMAVVNPGDVVLVPNPGYAPYERGARFVGAEVYEMPLRAENGFLPDLSAIPSEITRRARLMWLNYPNNPTGAVATPAFFAEVVAFARAHDVLVAHDAPYMDVTFAGYRAPSILETPGAVDVAVEFNSMSKTYNMAGWRLGAAVGNAAAVRALHTLKSNIESGHFAGMLEAGIVALNLDEGWLAERNAIYARRRDLVLDGLAGTGLVGERVQASLYVWLKLPDGVGDSLGYCTRLLEATGVSVTAGSAFGRAGEGFVRVSLGMGDGLMGEAVERWREWAMKG